MNNRQVSFIYMWLGVVFTTCIVAANILETKVVEVGPITLTGGLLCFPVSYIIGDVVSEVYGFKSMLRLITMGLLMNLLVVVLGNIAAILPSPDYWEGEEGFNFIFSFAPRITFASFLAFVVGSVVNSKIMEQMHHKHGEKYFCVRAIWSTILGEGADSVVFFPIAFGGILPFRELVELVLLQLCLKTAYEILILPITVRVVRFVNKLESKDLKPTTSEGQEEKETEIAVSRNIALVLADGGAKGYAHIGAIRAIEENGLKIQSIAGTSMGALVGGLYAAGKLDAAFEYMKTINKKEVFHLSDLKHISMNGLMGGDNIYTWLQDLLGDVRIEDLPIKFCAIATNLDTGEEVVFRSGKLVDAIRASISMPAVFTPYIINNVRHVDGAIVNGLPINRVHKQPGDRVLAVNLDSYQSSEDNSLAHFLKYGADGPFSSFEKLKKRKYLGFFARTIDKAMGENFLNVLINSFFISLKQNKLMMVELSKPDIYINIDLKGYDTHNFNNAEAICNLGYEQVKSHLNNI